jgi:spermidine/putrescine-binding protein
MKRRTFLKLASTFAATAVAAPYVQAQSKKFSGITLRINGYGGLYDDTLIENVAKPLEEKFGLKIRFIAGATTQDMIKLIANRDNPPFDLFMSDSPQMAQLVEADILEPITAADAPNAGRVLPNFREFGEYGTPFSVASLVPLYNSKYITQPLTGYSDIARADLKGRVALPATNTTTSSLMLLALASGNGGSISNMEPAFKIMRSAKENIVSFAPTTIVHLQLFMNEEAAAGVFWDGRGHELRTKGKPFVTVIPREGIYSVTTYISIVKGCKYREAANAYVEQLLSDRGILGLPNALRYSTTTDVKLPAELKNDLLFNSDERVAMKQRVDWTQLMKLRGSWAERVNKDLAG